MIPAATAASASAAPTDTGDAAHNYNVRVALEEVDDAFGDDDDDEGMEGMEANVLTRDDMKKNAESMLDKATNKKKGKKKGKFATDASPGKTSGKAASGARPGMS